MQGLSKVQGAYSLGHKKDKESRHTTMWKPRAGRSLSPDILLYSTPQLFSHSSSSW